MSRPRRARDVKLMLAVCTTLPGFHAMTAMIGRRDDVLFSCGIHRLNLDEPYDFAELRRLAAGEGVVVLGETGVWITITSRITRRSSRRCSANIFVWDAR